MLTHSLRRWLVIETLLGDCNVFAWRVNIPALETPGNTIYWLNADVADVCDAGPALFQPKPKPKPKL